MSRLGALAAAFLMCVGAANAQTPPSPMTYSSATPAYRFYPGDQIDIAIYSAPELTRTATIAPDGRLSLPLIEPLQAADLSEAELEAALVASYSRFLRTPDIDVTARAFGSRQVFVGGEVARPGIYEMPASMDAFQAVMLAGGFLTSARRSDVLVLSRPPGGAAEVTEVDLSARALRRGLPGAVPLSRYDVVYVPRSGIAQVNLFMQQYIRDALPIQFSLYYDLNGDRNN
jgi:protein involved in polysaccharide export with SLBB domain